MGKSIATNFSTQFLAKRSLERSSTVPPTNTHSLSLAMFEALRGLRDAVAPESGNAAANTEGNNEPDFEEFWQSYRNNDPETVSAVLGANGGSPPQKREDYRRIFGKIEREKDAGLVARLATTVLTKSADVDERVINLQGMDRTRTQQMKLIQELLAQNAAVEEELQSAYDTAKTRRDQVRKLLQEQTCEALGIEEYRD